MLPAACRQFDMTIPAFLRRIIGAPAAGTLPAVLACVALRAAFPPASIGAIIAEGALVGAIYLVSALTIGLDRGIRTRYVDYARGLLMPRRRVAGNPAVGVP